MATSMLSMGAFMLMPFTSAFLVNNILIPQEKLPVIFLATGIASIIIMPMVGRLSDRVDKYKLFAIGSVWAAVMTLVQTNLKPVPIWVVIIVNMLLFMGIMSRMVPSMTLNSALPGASDRGAYMSINSSLQQMAGGVAAIFAGLVVVQPAKSAPLEHFNILGFAMVGIIAVSMVLVYRVSKIVEKKGLLLKSAS
jgi:predicted MFS family arabinose efflux permease